MHDMLEVAGGADAFADLQRQSLQLSAETLLARAPEVIIEVQTTEGWPPDRIARELAVWKALPCRAGRPDRPRPHHRRRSAVDPRSARGRRHSAPRAGAAPVGEVDRGASDWTSVTRQSSVSGVERELDASTSWT